MNEMILLAQDAGASTTTLAGLLLAAISVLAGVIAWMARMFFTYQETFAETIKSVSAKHDETVLKLDERWSGERDKDRNRADHREEVMAACLDRLSDRLPPRQ